MSDLEWQRVRDRTCEVAAGVLLALLGVGMCTAIIVRVLSEKCA